MRALFGECGVSYRQGCNRSLVFIKGQNASRLPPWEFWPSSRNKNGALEGAPCHFLEVISVAKSGSLHRIFRNVAGRRNALHTQLEVVSIGRVFKRSFVVDQPCLEQIPQGLIERL